ncbi:class I SAM-dependent methyltransferase [Neolewinella lacunae]|uniref:Class I SAM-dependent methyltransferase n=1 Tax=Neolewinella lacunae TaxID=1517758 RepID=A0A923TCF5_9BACT|nr:class I SAM-dependent methyltransferase [Neolewinella lacunae]MBC6993672.1 class I SAM-dependent methyltransferase [Neolewinella lacunae]MDN3636367.1 class I SAM-dependent methyltransferase [Neolewinella lacunae]
MIRNKIKEKNTIYEDEFVETLFNRMSETYGVLNYLSSFGFTELWRKQCVNEIDWKEDLQEGYDFMSGMGESWHLVMQNKKVKLVGIDMSSEMNKEAKKKLHKKSSWDVSILEENILENSLPAASADFIISTFGLKTFSPAKQKILAQEMYRVLKPGGQIALIEVSVPASWVLRIPFMFYLKRVVPVIGKLFMGNALDYRMLGVYCEKFKNCTDFKDLLAKEGMDVQVREYFFGCATGIVGRK